MHFDPRHRFHTHERRASARLSPTARLVMALAAILAVSLTPPTFLTIVPGYPLSAIYVLVAAATGAVVIAAYLPVLTLARRMLVFLPLLVFIAASVPLAHGFQDGWFAMLAVIIKGSICFGVMLVLASTTPFEELLTALCRLRVPTLFVATLAFMHRYLYLIQDELARMRRARAARTFDHSPRPSLRGTATLVGMVLLRSFARAERVHAAMISRGFDGDSKSLEHLGAVSRS